MANRHFAAAAAMSRHHDQPNRQPAPGAAHPPGGFTMIELLVVLMVISLATAFTLPSIRTSLFSDQLKGTSRRLVGFIVDVSQDAVNKQSEYVLHFDLGNNLVRAVRGTGPEPGLDEPGARTLEIPESVRVVDISTAHGGKSGQGTATLTFSKKGYVDKTAIHLRSDDGRDMTIVLSPFLGVIRIFDSYVELEDEQVRL
ncbi:MAG: type II secretion system GspH family protein [Desulfobulbaceae bacterium]|nr:type II secretion system GspH family protein [Desulfobulbaceae bacterium]